MPTDQHTPFASKPRTGSLMVAVMTGPNPPVVGLSEHLPRWKRLTPAAIWTQVGLRDHGEAAILQDVAAALDRHGMAPRQLILLGQGAAASSAIELVLRSALPCGGLIAIGPSDQAWPSRITRCRTAIRLVVHDDGCTEMPDGFFDALRAADIDERIIRLNVSDPRIVASATETFLLELVASIGRQGQSGSSRE